MAVNISKLAVVHKHAQVGEGCEIGPFCTIGPDVVIGDNTVFKSHVTVDGHTQVGCDCLVYPFATLGLQSQDLKYVQGTVTYTEIGNRNIIREYVCIHSGTEEYSTTSLGDDCALLAQSHVAHNCQVGNNVVLSHGATIGGYVKIGDRANLGGVCAVQQFCQIGHVAMVAGLAKVVQDVLPFTIASGHPAKMRSINKVGMERARYAASEIADIRKAFRILFFRDNRLVDAVQQIRNEMGSLAHVSLLVDAIEASTQGLARPHDMKCES